MRTTCILFAAFWLSACSSTQGDPLEESELGLATCEDYFGCGPGRYCSEAGVCAADCRTTADCALLGEGMICNRFGECLAPDGGRRCSAHADCGEGRFCNGTCSSSGASCGGDEVCPYGASDVCEGTCGAHCGHDNDCAGYEKELSCTPVGQCLQRGWEEWIPPGELPPLECDRDSQCKSLGWAYHCDCPKELHRSGVSLCSGGVKSVCVPDEEPLDFGDGPEASPAHPFRGVWGMRMVIGTVTVGVPLVTRQNTYSSNLILVKISHEEGDRLHLEEKLCDIKLINFRDDDEPFDDLAWMLIPHFYLSSLPILHQQVEVSSAAAGSPFETTRSLEVRGVILDDPVNDPLPTRHDYDADPGDPRFWDQDQDGNVGMTTFMDGVLRGEIYNAQRWAATYHGEILDADHVRGLSTIENEMKVLSASSQSLIYDTTDQIHDEEDRTFFRLMRLDEDASCADLIREGERNDSWLRHTNHLMDVPDP